MCTFQELLETTSESAGLCGTLIQEAVVMRFFLGTMLLIFIGRICRICRIVPPLNIFGLGGVRVPILFGNYLPRNDLPYSKGFMKFGCPEPSKKMFDFWHFCSSKRHLTGFVRVPPYEILVLLISVSNSPLHYNAIVAIREWKNHEKIMARFYSFFDQILFFWFLLVWKCIYLSRKIIFAR